MKQFLLAASACVGLFAFTRVGVSRDHHTPGYSYTSTDTTKKPDSIGTAAFTGSVQMDTTMKPKPDSMRLAIR